MARRSTKRRARPGEFNAAHYREEESRVRALFPAQTGKQSGSQTGGKTGGPGHAPASAPPAAGAERDQSYLRRIKARSGGQQGLIDAIEAHNLTLALGPAGTGKTYIAVAKAVEALEDGAVGRIVLSRPAVEAGESIGFLPGAMEDKLAPYLRPLYDALTDRLSPRRLRALMNEGQIEIAPVGYMRGRTLNNAFVVIDEAQNCTFGQLKMLLTRLGWSSTMVVTGDPNQSDLLPELSGLATVAEKLDAVEDVAVVRLCAADIVRHPLVASMLDVL